MTGMDSVFKGSAYLLGAATGVVLMVPLTVGALGAGAMVRLAPQPVAIEAMGPPGVLSRNAVQAPMVNRAAKGPRLNVAPAPPAATRTMDGEARPVVDNGPLPTPATPPRATRTPKGCLSAIGVTKSSLSTEDLTICVADASIIDQIN